jgi:hypothetical protein
MNIRRWLLAFVCLFYVEWAQGAGVGFFAGIDAAVVDPAAGAGPDIVFLSPEGGESVPSSGSTTDGSEGSWSAVLGYRINRHLAGELAYTHFGSIGTTTTYEREDSGLPVLPGEIPVDATSRIAGPSISLLGILPIGDHWEAFARVGLLLADREVQHDLANFVTTFAEEQWVLGVGVDIKFARRWRARIEYQGVEEFPRHQLFASELRLDRYGLGLAYDF